MPQDLQNKVRFDIKLEKEYDMRSGTERIFHTALPYLHDLAFDMILPNCNFLLDIMHVCFSRESLLCDEELPAQKEITS